MKIGIIHTSYVLRGGEDIVMEQEYRLLKSNNVEVSVLCFKNPDSTSGKIFHVINSVFNLQSFVKVKEWIRKEKPDIIHLHNWHFRGSPAIISAAKQKGIPVVHTLHNFRLLCPSATLFHHNKLFLSSLKSAFPWKAIYQRVYRNSMPQTFLIAFTVWYHKWKGTWQSVDKFITLTSKARDMFLSYGIGMQLTEDKVVVKSNFAADLQYEENPGKDTFLFVGRLTEEKGVNTLLEAFKNTSLSLKIIGEGPLSHDVESVCATHSNIVYLGFRDRNYIQEALRNSTAFICPSIWLEGNPLTIIEAFGSGTPVIASRLGAMEAMVQEGYNGLLFSPGDSAELRSALFQWKSKSPDEQLLLRRNARETYCREYTPERNLEQLLCIYKSLLHEKS